MSENNQSWQSITVMLTAGRLSLPLLDTVAELMRDYPFELYLSTAQNLRLIKVREEDVAPIKSRLAGVGADFKAPGKFPVPKVCVGLSHCTTGIGDTERLSRLILERFGHRTGLKPKLKIAIAGCPLSCSGALLADIGVIATRQGWEIHAGGKGGPKPQVGRRIIRQAGEEQVVEVIGKLVDFHQLKTGTKQRLRKLLDDPEFPYPGEESVISER
jgi:NAD(P)H-nitrite reductase large subunit